MNVPHLPTLQSHNAAQCPGRQPHSSRFSFTPSIRNFQRISEIKRKTTNILGEFPQLPVPLPLPHTQAAQGSAFHALLMANAAICCSGAERMQWGWPSSASLHVLLPELRGTGTVWGCALLPGTFLPRESGRAELFSITSLLHFWTF